MTEHNGNSYWGLPAFTGFQSCWCFLLPTGVAGACSQSQTAFRPINYLAPAAFRKRLKNYDDGCNQDNGNANFQAPILVFNNSFNISLSADKRLRLSVFFLNSVFKMTQKGQSKRSTLLVRKRISKDYKVTAGHPCVSKVSLIFSIWIFWGWYVFSFREQSNRTTDHWNKTKNVCIIYTITDLVKSFVVVGEFLLCLWRKTRAWVPALKTMQRSVSTQTQKLSDNQVFSRLSTRRRR